MTKEHVQINDIVVPRIIRYYIKMFGCWMLAICSRQCDNAQIDSAYMFESGTHNLFLVENDHFVMKEN